MRLGGEDLAGGVVGGRGEGGGVCRCGLCGALRWGGESTMGNFVKRSAEGVLGHWVNLAVLRERSA